MKVFEIVAKTLVYIILLCVITLCWVGAEYLFEGAVHSSKVDGFFAGMLAFCMVREIDHIDKEVFERRKEGDGNG